MNVDEMSERGRKLFRKVKKHRAAITGPSKNYALIVAESKKAEQARLGKKRRNEHIKQALKSLANNGTPQEARRIAARFTGLAKRMEEKEQTP